VQNKQFTKLFAIGLLIVAAIPFCHGLSRHVVVSIPFEFVVANKTLPAGEYVLWPANQNAIRIQGAKGANYAIVLTGAISRHKSDHLGQAVFTCYGDHCFLSQVWFAGDELGRELVQSSSERHLAKRHAVHYAAVLPLNAQS
jgi:hypothetical protein